MTKRARLLKADEEPAPLSIDEQIAKAAQLMPLPAVMQPGTPEWREARRSGLGGSDIAAALGLSPWMTPYELWLDKLGELPERPDTDPMRWGRLLEPLILHAYAERTGWKLSRPRMLRSARYPWLIANLDGIANTGGFLPVTGRVVEAKCAHSRLGWGEPGSSDVPQQYLLQGMSYLIVTGLQECDVVVLFGGNDLQVYTIHADAELQQMIIEGTGQFWRRHVQGLEPPSPAGMEDAKRRWGRLAERGNVTATPQDVDMVRGLRETRAMLKTLEADEDAAAAALMARLGDHGDTLIDPANGQPLVTWKLAAGPQRFDLELFKTDHPDLYGKYAITGAGARRFIVKKEYSA